VLIPRSNKFAQNSADLVRFQGVIYSYKIYTIRKSEITRTKFLSWLNSNLVCPSKSFFFDRISLFLKKSESPSLEDLTTLKNLVSSYF